MSKIIYLSLKKDTPPSGYWDMAFLNDLLSSLPMDMADRTVFIIPGAYQGNIIDKINKKINEYKKVLVFITSDEEGKFDCEKLSHPDMIHYRQYGYCKNVFPIGYTTETRNHLKKIGLVNKDISIFFSGQLNSLERKQMFSRLALYDRAVLFGTDGFSRGLPPEIYYNYMNHSVLTPSPGGHVSPDSFRFYEGLEAGAIPVSFPEYMNKLFIEPFDKDSKKRNYIDVVFSWWIRQKMLLRQRLKQELGINEAMTVIIPTSPIPSHPDTKIIDETIKSIRAHTLSDIILTIDGVRPEEENKRGSYSQYIKRLLWKCNFEYKNVLPLLFDKHLHQSGMMKEALKYVKTPLIMYVEHDTPLVTDRKIDWNLIAKTLLEKQGNVVRLHFEAFIPEPHKHLMLGQLNDNFLKTIQWSQRPHIVRTEFYREIMKFFSSDSNCFLEDKLYGLAVESNWDLWKILIYTPDKNIKRSLNLDGRAGGYKFEKEQKF